MRGGHAVEENPSVGQEIQTHIKDNANDVQDEWELRSRGCVPRYVAKRFIVAGRGCLLLFLISGFIGFVAANCEGEWSNSAAKGMLRSAKLRSR
jgi:hypothetical protein